MASVRRAWSRASSPISSRKAGLYSTFRAPERTGQGMEGFGSMLCVHSTWKSAGSERNQRSSTCVMRSFI